MIGPHLFQTKTTITLSNINKIELAKLRNKMWITIGLNKKNLITFLTSNYHKQLPLCCRVVSLCSVSEPRPHHADLPPSGAAEHVWSAILFGWAGALLLHHDKPNSMFVCTSL
jgi:hypothetical protein